MIAYATGKYNSEVKHQVYLEIGDSTAEYGTFCVW